MSAAVFLGSLVLVQLLGQDNWDVVRLVDEFTDEVSVDAVRLSEDGQFLINIDCGKGDDDAIISIGVFGLGEGFGSTTIRARWDTGPIENWPEPAVPVGPEILTFAQFDHEDFVLTTIRNLYSRDLLRIEYWNASNDRSVARISLSDADAVLDEVGCRPLL